MFNSQKLGAITTSTLIVGVDIAKKVHGQDSQITVAWS